LRTFDGGLKTALTSKTARLEELKNGRGGAGGVWRSSTAADTESQGPSGNSHASRFMHYVKGEISNQRGNFQGVE